MKGEGSMRTLEEINKIMETIPKEWRHRWCGGENGTCACIGCVQIGNRLIMAKETLGIEYTGDPEHIDESRIPKEIYDKYKISKEEWEFWKSINPI
jgi:hypothetical protein